MAVKEQQQQASPPAAAVPVVAPVKTPPFTGAVVGGPPPAAPVENNKKAIWSLVCAIIGLFILGIVLGPVAIFLGVQAKQEIKARPSQLKGEGMATAGIVIGVIAFIGSIIIIAMLA